MAETVWRFLLGDLSTQTNALSRTKRVLENRFHQVAYSSGSEDNDDILNFVSKRKQSIISKRTFCMLQLQ